MQTDKGFRVILGKQYIQKENSCTEVEAAEKIIEVRNKYNEYRDIDRQPLPTAGADNMPVNEGGGGESFSEKTVFYSLYICSR